jgi:hypothetical protein
MFEVTGNLNSLLSGPISSPVFIADEVGHQTIKLLLFKDSVYTCINQNLFTLYTHRTCHVKILAEMK